MPRNTLHSIASEPDKVKKKKSKYQIVRKNSLNITFIALVQLY